MCFHNSLSVKAQQLSQRYELDISDDELEPIFHGNGFSFPKWPIITSQVPDKFQFYSWGLIPQWSRTKEDALKMRLNTLNARSETIFEKPSFKASIRYKRCLVPSTGFYEWRDHKGAKYPYFISLREQEIFSMAGIYERYTDKQTGEVMDTFSIATCPANPLMAKIHNSKERMPVILTKEDEKIWIREKLSDQEIKDLMQPLDERLMKAHTISKLITSRKENSNVPAVQEMVACPDLDAL